MLRDFTMGFTSSVNINHHLYITTKVDSLEKYNVYNLYNTKIITCISHCLYVYVGAGKMAHLFRASNTLSEEQLPFITPMPVRSSSRGLEALSSLFGHFHSHSRSSTQVNTDNKSFKRRKYMYVLYIT